MTPGPLSRGDSAASRLSLNTATVKGAGLLELVDACAAHGYGWIAPWRELLADVPPARARRAIRDAGLGVSSLCRGGFFPAPTPAARQERLEDNYRAVDEAAELGTDVLVLVCGGVVGKDIRGSRLMVRDALASLLPHAAARGVRLGVEPLHPIFAADRSVITTLGEANALVEELASPWLGVVVDVYHVWWDPAVEEGISRAGQSVLGFHVNDWIVPLPDMLAGRGVMGDGYIDLRHLREVTDAAGYQGPIEVEIFNQELWAKPVDEVLPLLRRRFLETVA